MKNFNHIRTDKKQWFIINLLLFIALGAMAQTKKLEAVLQNSLMNGEFNEQCIGDNNCAFGKYALSKSTTGSHNVAFGLESAFSNTTGFHNTATGSQSLLSNTSGSNNSAFGRVALRDNTSGNQNSAFGDQALAYNIASNNTAVGYKALLKNTEGHNNTALGYMADLNEEDLINATVIGAGAIVTRSNSVQLGNADLTTVVAGTGSKVTLLVGRCVLGDVDSPPSTPEGYNLYVKNGILAEKVKVALSNTTDWSDYVFAKDYALQSLQEVEAFVKTNKHLPGVPSAQELVNDGGIDVNKMFAKQMEKIEELTLYLIDMNKEIETLKKENATLKSILTGNNH